MNHTTGALQTPDGISLHTESWLPEGDPKAIVLIVHGLAEHIGRYAHVAAFLVERGYGVYGLDHRGHGKSPGLRAYFESFNQPIADLKQYLDRVKAAHPGKNVFLYGHSLGALLGLAFLLTHQNEVAGAIISGVTLGVEDAQPAPLVAVGAALSRVVPTLPTVPLDSKGLSHNPAVVAAYDNDPLVHRGNVRARMGNYIVTVSRAVRRRLHEITLPLLILHGGSDPICPAAGSETLYRGVASSDKTLRIYPDLLHEIHNEPEQATIFAEIAAWLDKRVAPQA
ncbi:MAG: alpha/beta hydrolase [Chloroflexi bacterium]|nr:alpha/beta hydrolase [Chloroflexota bacterium]